jgi:hypothetical protein
MEEMNMSLASRIKNALPFLSAQQIPPEPPALPDALQAIIDADRKSGRELTVQEIQDLTGWDTVTLTANAPRIGMARVQYAQYQQALDDYEIARAKREFKAEQREARKSAKKQPPQPKDDNGSQPGNTDVITGEARTLEERITPRGKSFSDLTADELSIRRREILANTPFDIPLHRKFMNSVKETWRVIGPPAFVVFTVWEVYYFMNHFLRASNVFDVVLLWGISLIIEIPFMVATYDQSERRERAAERRARNEEENIPGKNSSLVFWVLLALVNVAGQIAFLGFVTHVGLSLIDPSVIGLWFFIVLRVTGVIIGDCYTAFHLLPTEASIDRVLRAQQAQMEGERRLAASDARRMREDAEAKRDVRLVELSVKRDERESDFMEQWQVMNMRQTLERQRRFIEMEQQQYPQLGAPNGAQEPEMGDL